MLFGYFFNRPRIYALMSLPNLVFKNFYCLRFIILSINCINFRVNALYSATYIYRKCKPWTRFENSVVVLISPPEVI